MHVTLAKYFKGLISVSLRFLRAISGRSKKVIREGHSSADSSSHAFKKLESQEKGTERRERREREQKEELDQARARIVALEARLRIYGRK